MTSRVAVSCNSSRPCPTWQFETRQTTLLQSFSAGHVRVIDRRPLVGPSPTTDICSLRADQLAQVVCDIKTNGLEMSASTGLAVYELTSDSVETPLVLAAPLPRNE